MPIKIKGLVTVADGKPMWRALTRDEIVAWHLSPEAKQLTYDGSARQPPGGKIGSSDGKTRYRVLLINRTSKVFGQVRSGCAVVQAQKGPKWFCYMGDIVEADLGGGPAPLSQDKDEEELLLSTLEEDSKPLPLGTFEDEGDFTFTPYTTEQMAALELGRRERDAKRLDRAMAEFGELNLEVRRRVSEIRKRYGLRENWVGTLQIRINEAPK